MREGGEAGRRHGSKVDKKLKRGLEREASTVNPYSHTPHTLSLTGVLMVYTGMHTHRDTHDHTGMHTVCTHIAHMWTNMTQAHTCTWHIERHTLTYTHTHRHIHDTHRHAHLQAHIGMHTVHAHTDTYVDTQAHICTWHLQRNTLHTHWHTYRH